MKIVLVNPPIGNRRSIEIPTRSHNPFEHLGLGYIASYLRKFCHEVVLIDSYITDRSIEETIDLILKETPRMTGLSATHEFLTTAVTIAEGLRNRGYDGHITLGGYLSTFLHDAILRDFPCFDSVVRGEGELTCRELAERINKPALWNTIAGLSFRQEGQVMINPPRSVISHLDSLPFPARDTLPHLQKIADYSAISSSRGCPMNCTFCSIHSFYKLSGDTCWRPRSAENTFQEMEMLVKNYNVNQIAFTDDNFLGIPGKGKDRAIKLAKLILQKGLKVEFSILCRVNDLDEGILRLLKMAGLRSLFVGFESGVDRALKTFNKKVTVEQNKKAVEIIKKVGIKCYPGFIMFDPWTTLEEIRQNLEFIEYVEESSSLIAIDDLMGSLQPFTGTPIKEKLKKEGRLIYQEPPSYKMLKYDMIPSYVIADPKAEALKQAVKYIRNSLKRPLFDSWSAYKRLLPQKDFSETIKLDETFNKTVKRMKDFEKHCFYECLKYLESAKPEDLTDPAAITDFAQNEIRTINKEIEELNDEIIKLTSSSAPKETTQSDKQN